MEISKESWTKYVETMAAINKKANRIMQAYIDKNGYEDRKKLIERAYQISSIYGEANGSLACQMYDEIARLQGAHVPNAEMADTANYGEVAKAVQGTMINQNSTVPGTVERLTKQVGADTMLKNAKRDGAEWAWIPGGSETCAFCIALASQGWMPASRAQVHGSHASHIHANCKCEFAIRFDKKSSVEGYDPDRYYDMYINASSSNSSKKKINALRRNLNELRRHKDGSKVKITEQAIQKVKRAGTKSMSNEEIEKVYEMHKMILRTSKDKNDSNEVAMILSSEREILGPQLGNQYSVDIERNIEIFHELLNSPKGSVILAHNHPGLSYYSMNDIQEFLTYPAIKTMTIVTNQGKTFFITKSSYYDEIKAKKIYNETIRKVANKRAKFTKNVDLEKEAVKVFFETIGVMIEKG